MMIQCCQKRLYFKKICCHWRFFLLQYGFFKNNLETKCRISL